MAVVDGSVDLSINMAKMVSGRLPPGFIPKLHEVMRPALDEWREEMLARWPVDTGRSQSSWQNRMDGVVWILRNPVEYAEYVHKKGDDVQVWVDLEQIALMLAQDMAMVMQDFVDAAGVNDVGIDRSIRGTLESESGARLFNEQAAAFRETSSRVRQREQLKRFERGILPPSQSSPPFGGAAPATAPAATAAPAAPAAPATPAVMRQEIDLEDAHVLENARQFLDGWVSSQNSASGVAMKQSINKVMGTGIKPFLPAGAKSTDARLKRAEKAITSLYQLTQKALIAEHGAGRTIKLYRGMRTNEYIASNMESWTDKQSVARQSAGHGGIVVEQEIPIERILGWYDGPVWKNVSGFRGEREYLILGEKPR